MWEFLGKKKGEKEVVSPETAVSPEMKVSETGPTPDTMAEQAAEKVNEKYAAILSQSNPSHQADPVIPDIHTDAEKLGQVIDTTSQVNQLVELAQIKGVAHAVAVARKLNDLYVLDTMHDEMADRLYDAFKAKGLILGE